MKQIAGSDIVIKIAETNDEFDQIHRLNYETFVNEIRQHHDVCEEGKLIDKFHHENVYFIACVENEVVGMMAYRRHKPFSLASKLYDLESFLEPFDSPCEIRLLAIKDKHRRSSTLFKLMYAVLEHLFASGNDVALVSAIVKEIKLYKHMGFEEFAYPVKSGDAYFQPMRCTWLGAILPVSVIKKMPQDKTVKQIYLTPGPIRSFSGVEDAYALPPLPHRSDAFLEIFEQTRTALKSLVQAKHVQIAMGTGTLANDMIAARLSLSHEHGLILTNGEFGNRLIDHAKRANLCYHVIQAKWGEPFSEAAINDCLSNMPDIKWIWMVHCETSTGMLNDLTFLNNLALRSRVNIILDCVSSMGTVPVDLSNVYLASGSSAKALGAKPGLAFVFHNDIIHPAPDKIPAVLDLGYYSICRGVPFTLSSSLIRALHAALQNNSQYHYWSRNKYIAARIRRSLEAVGVTTLVSEHLASPAVMTLQLPGYLDSVSIGDEFAKRGIWLNYGSNYLKQRNWLQLSLMGDMQLNDIVRFLACIDLFKSSINENIDMKAAS